MATTTFRYQIRGAVTVDDVTLRQGFLGIPRIRTEGVTADQVFENDQTMTALAGQLPPDQLAHDVLINAVATALRQALSGIPDDQLIQGLQVEIVSTESAD